MAVTIMTGSRFKASGFAYMALLTVLAASLITMSVALPDIYQQAKREREAQLLFVGLQYQQAIKSFYQNPFVSLQRFPENLDELLVDNRSIKPLYHLRRLYRDPMTQTGNWEMILNEEQQIIGVHSLSTERLLKTHLPEQGISIANITGGALTYADLNFVYQPESN